MQIYIKNFKSIVQSEFEPGNVNVFIGANGSGKSAILEAIGVLSAAMSEKVDDATLKERGVRLGTPSLYKSSFENQDRIPLTIELAAEWDKGTDLWKYKVNLNNPIEDPKPTWEYYSESLERNAERVFGRSRASRYELGNFPEIEIDRYRGLFAFLQGLKHRSHDIEATRELFEYCKDYAIYTPNTATLRGIQPDPTQREPIGLFGGRLSEAVDDLIDSEEELFGNLDLDDLLVLLDWVGGITVGKPTKDILSPNVPSTHQTIRFTDRFMKENRNVLTSYDASEGSLYVLFVLALAMHKRAPKMFAIDNFDQAMHPRLARKVMHVLSSELIRRNAIAYITTHNPLVLDGLDLADDRVRLFAVERDKHGHTQIIRVHVNEDLLKMGREGYSLSRLWIMGRLGGVPNI